MDSGHNAADTGLMQRRPPFTNWLILIGSWAGLAAVFLALQQNMSWTLLFPLMGLTWTAVPLLATTFPTRSLVVGSVVTLTAVAVVFLALLWLAVMVLGFLVPLVIESASEPDGGTVAVELALEGLKLLPGAALGIGIGVSLRRPDRADQASAR